MLEILENAWKENTIWKLNDENDFVFVSESNDFE